MKNQNGLGLLKLYWGLEGTEESPSSPEGNISTGEFYTQSTYQSRGRIKTFSDLQSLKTFFLLKNLLEDAIFQITNQ